METKNKIEVCSIEGQKRIINAIQQKTKELLDITRLEQQSYYELRNIHQGELLNDEIDNILDFQSLALNKILRATSLVDILDIAEIDSRSNFFRNKEVELLELFFDRKIKIY
jgi:hypothetical protein